MTCMGVLVQPKAAYLFTDTAYYLDDGTVSGFCRKVAEINTDPRGICWGPAKIAYAMTGFISPDQFAPVFEEMLRRGVRSTAGILHALPELFQAFCDGAKKAKRAPGVTGECIAMAIACHDAHFGPKAFVIGNEDNPFPADGYKPFTLVSVQRYMAGLPSDHPHAPHLEDPRRFDPIRQGGEVFDALRLSPFGPADDPWLGIGGKGIVTEIGAAGVRHHQVREWPDRAGERIMS